MSTSYVFGHLNKTAAFVANSLVLRILSLTYLYRVAQKKPPPIFQKIALKIADEIRFLRKVKV